MTDPLSLPPPVGEPAFLQPPGKPGRARPWWGLGDVVLSLPFIIIAAVIGVVIGLPFVGSDELSSLADGEQADLPVALLATSLLGQQLGQGLWPFIVSRWKGLGPVTDWRLPFKPIDILIGIGTAFIAVGAASVAAAIVSALVDLTDEAEAGNTQFLEDAEGTPWVFVLLFAVVIGAPLVEEIFFRGLVLRAFEKRGGQVLAVVGSTLIFTLPHFTGAGWAATAVLFASIGVVGAVLGTVTIKVGRLWPAVFAHMLFNSLGAAQALGAFGDLAN